MGGHRGHHGVMAAWWPRGHKTYGAKRTNLKPNVETADHGVSLLRCLSSYLIYLVCGLYENQFLEMRVVGVEVVARRIEVRTGANGTHRPLLLSFPSDTTPA